MSIEQLMAVVRPPTDPIETRGPASSRRIQDRFSMALPADYVDLANSYGTGTFLDSTRTWIRVFNPFSDLDFAHLRQICDLFRELKSEFPSDFPNPVFPDPQGLLPWAAEADGGVFCWLTKGRCEEWPIMIKGARDSYLERFDMPVTTFLAGVFARTIQCMFWHDPVFFSGPQPVIFERMDLSRSN